MTPANDDRPQNGPLKFRPHRFLLEFSALKLCWYSREGGDGAHARVLLPLG